MVESWAERIDEISLEILEDYLPSYTKKVRLSAPSRCKPDPSPTAVSVRRPQLFDSPDIVGKQLQSELGDLATNFLRVVHVLGTNISDAEVRYAHQFLKQPV